MKAVCEPTNVQSIYLKHTVLYSSYHLKALSSGQNKMLAQLILEKFSYLTFLEEVKVILHT